MKSCILLLVTLFITLQSFSQDSIVPAEKKVQWPRQKEYDHLLKYKLFKEGMTDVGTVLAIGI